MGRAQRALLGFALALLALTPASAGAATGLPPIRHVFIIMLENKSFDETFGYNSPAPYLSLTLPSMGALVPDYYGVTHESNGNYIALVSGQGSNPLTQADCQIYVNVTPGTIGAAGQAEGAGCVYPTAVKTVADQLSAGGLTWKAYMGDMGNGSGQPQTCRHPALGSLDSTQTARPGDQYAARHNPFVYFHSLLDSGACARDDVPLTALPSDLASYSTTPNYSFITPNLCDDGHDNPCVDKRAGGLAGINRFLSTWVPKIVASPAYQRDGLLAILFDEADGTDASSCCGEPQFPNTLNNGFLAPGLGGGRTGAVLLSPFIDPGTLDLDYYNHFTFLRSVEDIFGVGHLGFAAQAGLRSLGPDVFTCYAASTPRAAHGVLPSGSEIKLAVIGQGTAARPLVEIKLWHAGKVQITEQASGWRHLRTIRRSLALGPCQLAKLPLGYAHGTVTITATTTGGSERRTLYF